MPGIQAWGTRLIIIINDNETKVAKALYNVCRILISLYLLLEPVMSGYLYSIVYGICTIVLSRVAD